MKKTILISCVLFSIFSYSQNNKKDFDCSNVKTQIIHCKPCANGKSPMFIINDKVVTKKDFDKLNPNTIKTLSVFKGEKAQKLYGKKAKEGIIVVILKTKKEIRQERRIAKKRAKNQLKIID